MAFEFVEDSSEAKTPLSGSDDDIGSDTPDTIESVNASKLEHDSARGQYSGGTLSSSMQSLDQGRYDEHNQVLRLEFISDDDARVRRLLHVNINSYNKIVYNYNGVSIAVVGEDSSILDASTKYKVY